MRVVLTRARTEFQLSCPENKRESSRLGRLRKIAKDGFNTITLQSGAVLSMTEAGLAPNSVISLNGAATGTVSSVVNRK